MTIGQRIKDRRLELGLTQDELAKRMGMDRSHVCRYEKQEEDKISQKTLKRFADALNVKPSYFVNADLVGSVDFAIGATMANIVKDKEFASVINTINTCSATNKEKLKKYLTMAIKMFEEEIKEDNK